jgi:hypothetical protein
VKNTNSSQKYCNRSHIPNETTIEAIQQAECGHELESFDNVQDLFKSWDDSSTKDEKLDSSDRRRSLNRKTKEHILSRLLNESAGKISRDTNAAHSQDFLYGEDGMPN